VRGETRESGARRVWIPAGPACLISGRNTRVKKRFPVYCEQETSGAPTRGWEKRDSLDAADETENILMGLGTHFGSVAILPAQGKLIYHRYW
jgi:hypothetical protein